MQGFGNAAGAAWRVALMLGCADPSAGVAALPAARISPTIAVRMSTPEPAAAVAGDREMLENLIIDSRPPTVA
jgi:hypothetical protein